MEFEAGQKVAILTIGSSTNLVAAVIERVTATQVVIGTKRFRRDTGMLIKARKAHDSWLDPVVKIVDLADESLIPIRARQITSNLLSRIASLRVEASDGLTECQAIIGTLKSEIDTFESYLNRL